MKKKSDSLMVACENGHTTIVQNLLQNKANINAQAHCPKMNMNEKKQVPIQLPSIARILSDAK